MDVTAAYARNITLRETRGRPASTEGASRHGLVLAYAADLLGGDSGHRHVARGSLRAHHPQEPKVVATRFLDCRYSDSPDNRIVDLPRLHLDDRWATRTGPRHRITALRQRRFERRSESA